MFKYWVVAREVEESTKKGAKGTPVPPRGSLPVQGVVGETTGWDPEMPEGTSKVGPGNHHPVTLLPQCWMHYRSQQMSL